MGKTMGVHKTMSIYAGGIQIRNSKATTLSSSSSARRLQIYYTLSLTLSYTLNVSSHTKKFRPSCIYTNTTFWVIYKYGPQGHIKTIYKISLPNRLLNRSFDLSIFGLGRISYLLSIRFGSYSSHPKGPISQQKTQFQK